MSFKFLTYSKEAIFIKGENVCFLFRLDAKTLAERRIHSADIASHLSGRMLDRRAIVKHNQVNTVRMISYIS